MHLSEQLRAIFKNIKFETIANALRTGKDKKTTMHDLSGVRYGNIQRGRSRTFKKIRRAEMKVAARRKAVANR